MPSVGSVTEDERSFVEEWENVATSTNYIVKLDYRGDDRPQAIQGPQKFKLTTYERILTEDKIRDPRHDPFKNGCFRPIMVPEGVDVETNPNALSDEDIQRIFGASANAWESYMDVIDSPETLGRMLRLAEESDKLSLSRFREIEAKASEHSNVGKKFGQKDEELYDQINPGAATPPRRGRPPKTSSGQ